MIKQIFITFFILASIGYGAYCTYGECYSTAQEYALQAEAEVGASYATLKAAISSSESSYEEYKDAISDQNDILENIINVRKDNTLKNLRIKFLLKKILEDKSVQIERDTLKELLEFVNDNHITLRAKIDTIMQNKKEKR